MLQSIFVQLAKAETLLIRSTVIIFYLLSLLYALSPHAHAVPGTVGALSATTRVFSIMATWNVPLVPNGIIIAYEVHSVGEQENRIQNVTADSQFIELTRLSPQTTYRIAVRAYTIAGAGVWTNISATTESIRTYFMRKLIYVGCACESIEVRLK